MDYYKHELEVAQKKFEATGNKEEYISTETNEAYQKVVKYLEVCEANSEKACNNILRALEGKPIT